MTALHAILAALSAGRTLRARGPHHDHVLAPYKPSIGKPWALYSYGRVAGAEQPYQKFATANGAAAAFVAAVGERRALAAASGRVAMRPAPPSQPPIT